MVTISKALPVKLWLTGEDSYNSKSVDGIDDYCYHQQIQTDDEIKLQFKSDQEIAYKLKLTDVDGGLIAEVPFTLIDSAVDAFTYEVTVVPSDYGVVNQLIKCEIKYDTLGTPEPIYFGEPSELTPVYFGEPSETSPVYLGEPEEL